jgi:hypothetical protein
MPAVSEKQQRFMAMCAHNPKHAAGSCPSKAVAHEFSHKPAKGYKRKKHSALHKLMKA